MTRLHRTIIFYAFLLLFLIAAPLVLLQSAGYRYSLRTGRIGRVGILVLKSQPRDAAIKLNDRPRPTRTPASLALAPDKYRVTITLPGFHAWQKLLPIESQKTTFAEDIILWKEAEPTFLGDITPLAVTRNGRIAIHYDTVRGLVLFDATTQTLTPVTDLAIGDGAPRAEFAPNEQMALVTYEDTRGRAQVLVVRVSGGEIVDTSFFTRLRLNHLTWAETPGTLYGNADNRLYSVNLFTKRAEVFAQSEELFAVRGTTVWSIGDENRVLLLRSRAGEPQKAPEPVGALPTGSYELLPAPDPYLLLHETTRDRLLVLDTKNPTEIAVDIPGAHGLMRVNRDGEAELLGWNQFELWRAQVASGTTELLRRESAPQRGAAWYPTGEYVAIASRDRVETLELDARGGRTSTELARFPDHEMSNLLFESRGAKLFFTVTGGPQAGLYSLELQ